MAAIIAHRRRQRQRRERIYRPFNNPLFTFDEDGIIARFRLSPPLINILLRTIGPDLQRQTARGHAISPVHQILMALSFYASGSFQLQIADMLNVSKSTVSRSIRAVSRSIRDKLDNIIFPSRESLRVVKQSFYEMRHFPNVIGCIDGTLIPIKAPTAAEDEPSYVCRKNFHAINVQGVCDANLRFINIVAKYPGSTHDAFVFNNCSLRDDLENGVYGDGWLLGDSGYACRPYLLTPKNNTNTPAEERFNRAHCGTRCVVERMFGVWKSRFRCLHKTGGCLNYRPTVCIDIIVACAKLHNLCRDHGLPDPEPLMEDDDETENVHIPAHDNNAGLRIRDDLIARRYM